MAVLCAAVAMFPANAHCLRRMIWNLPTLLVLVHALVSAASIMSVMAGRASCGRLSYTIIIAPVVVSVAVSEVALPRIASDFSMTFRPMRWLDDAPWAIVLIRVMEPVVFKANVALLRSTNPLSPRGARRTAVRFA